MKWVGIIIGVLLIAMLVIYGSLKGMKSNDFNYFQEQWQTLEQNTAEGGAKFDSAMVADLPPLVQRYFFHAIDINTPLYKSVELGMNGQFQLGTENNWLPLTATQILTPAVGFIWRADIGEAGMKIEGYDAMVSNTGRISFWVSGFVPVARSGDTTDVALSAAGRLFIESMWNPLALLPQNGVEWRVVNDSTIAYAQELLGEKMEVSLVLNDEGGVTASQMQRWGMIGDQETYSWQPFGSYITEEHDFGEVTIPSKMEAGWRFGTDNFTPFIKINLTKAMFR